MISENAGFTEGNSSAINVIANHNPSISNNIIKGNTMRRSPVGTNRGISFGNGGIVNGLAIEGNEIDGFDFGIVNSLANTNTLNGVNIQGNNINNSQTGGILIYPAGNATLAGTMHLNIANNTIIGSGNVSAGTNGIEVSLIDGV